jgi:hypothetical protein
LTPEKFSQLKQEILRGQSAGIFKELVTSSPIPEVVERQKNWLTSTTRMFDCATVDGVQSFRKYVLQENVVLYSEKKYKTKKTLVVCFTGMARRMMVPLPVFLQLFDARYCDVLIVNYPKGIGYRWGIKGLGEDFVRSIVELGNRLPSEEYFRRVSIGVSGGGLPAVFCSMLLGFNAAISFGGGHPNDQRWRDALGFDGEHLVRDVQKKSMNNPKISLVYGDQSEPDMLAAQALSKLVPSRVIKVSGCGHNTFHPLLMSGKIGELLKSSLFAGKAGVEVVLPYSKKALKKLGGPRYFAIGLNKTGTTTLGRCFLALGLTPIAEPRSPHMNFAALSQSIFDRKDFSVALEAADYFRAFQDRPWNIWKIYQQLDEKFPGSYFILTERDSEKWWQSVNRWLNVLHPQDGKKRQRYFDHLNVDKIEKSLFIEAYEKYNQEVKDYFAGRDNLLVMNLEQGDGWEKLCHFLGRYVPSIPFPHANKGS